ncbi:hypothetical protein SAMN02799631_03003 [Methylobacterium sp. 174MFSha1.1]|uniref:hypothetical protein n=1 Tax=Methylobacterium sp. 174MFSha1.1 TaxID=1502749 RepID=UPI0008E63A1D|nr:hypothetical protein [Methylobacterium sp. 174MFSha1.1]SFU90043.1 hypothetical protein SAMN02799631_03003 [Methylobacterium sp. 174MFSha1.1]
MRFAVPLVVACGLAAPALVAPVLVAPALAQSGRPPALLIHGNYCGPGNNAPLPPIDALDAACARHDACTPRGGMATPACNARLKREAELISRDPHQPRDLRDAAGFVAFAAGMMPSRPQVATGPTVVAPSIAPVFPAPSIDEDDDE